VDVVIERFAVYLVALGSNVGSEINKTRPCVVLSPEQLHRNLRTIIVAPMTTTLKRYPTRVPTHFAGKRGEIALDQIRAVDQSRLVKRLGSLRPTEAANVTQVLLEMFA
jgi:mRNA interferase MazF